MIMLSQKTRKVCLCKCVDLAEISWDGIIFSFKNNHMDGPICTLVEFSSGVYLAL